MFNKSDVESLEEAIKRLEQENRELKSDVLKWQKAFSRQYQINENKGYSKTEEKYRSALKEIREILKFYADSWVDEKIYPNLHYDNTKVKEGLSKINEVLK